MHELEHRTDRIRARGWLQAALGAVLAIGAYQIYEVFQPPAPPIVYDAGSIVAAAELDYVLDNPSTGGGAGGITVGKQFANKSGDRCRTFAQGYISGSACLRDGRWRLLEMTQRPLPVVD
jgi:hypothetical protein